MNTRKQGSIGLSAAIHYFVSKGFSVSVPLSDTQRYDLVVDDGGLKRVECKTSAYQKKGYYQVNLGTSGGNRSWTGKTKNLSKDDCDLVFIHLSDGTNYLIPSDKVTERRSLQLSPKWNTFKV